MGYDSSTREQLARDPALVAALAAGLIAVGAGPGAVRVLFLTHRLPYAANRGDRIRAFHILRFVAAHADVDLVSLVHSSAEARHAADLADVAATVTVAPVSRVRSYGRAIGALATKRPLTHAMLDARGLSTTLRRIVAEHPPDVVLAYCSGMARFALEPALHAFPLVLDMVDVDSEKWRLLGESARRPARWVYASEARTLCDFEARAARAARAVLVVNDRERTALLTLEPSASVHVVPNGVDVETFHPPEAPSSEARVTFCGVMNYRPNEEAALWLAQSVWPIVSARRPDARLALVGSDPPHGIRNLAARNPTIEVTGSVPDVRPHLWRSAVSVAPLFVARGVQNKVLEAVAAGLPVVVTPAVHEGLPPEVRPACRVAAEADRFAAAIVELLEAEPAGRRAIAARANLASLGWTERLSPLAGILDDAARRRAPAPTSRTDPA